MWMAGDFESGGGRVSILTGPEIARQVAQGRILVDPYDPRQLNPASYDVRLGETILEVLPNKAIGEDPFPYAIDPKKPPRAQVFESGRVGGVLLQPGRLYLGHTAERIRTDHCEPTIDGKSSIGRLGVFIHVTAGYGEPGFDGQYTLEIVVTLPTILYPGMLIGQVRFTTLEGEVQLYRGNYTGEHSRGPVASRAWKQFEADGESTSPREEVPWKPPLEVPLVVKDEGQTWEAWLDDKYRRGFIPWSAVLRFDQAVQRETLDDEAKRKLIVHLIDGLRLP